MAAYRTRCFVAVLIFVVLFQIDLTEVLSRKLQQEVDEVTSVDIPDELTRRSQMLEVEAAKVHVTSSSQNINCPPDDYCPEAP